VEFIFSVKIVFTYGKCEHKFKTVIHTPSIQIAFIFFVTLCKFKLMQVWTLLVKTRYSRYHHWNTRQTLRIF